jgi:hypothetical protein
MFDTHPGGWRNPVTLRAPAGLPALGGWDLAPVESSSAGARHVTLSFTYERGAAGGACDFQIETSIYAIAGNVPIGASEWVTESIYASGAVAAGADTTSLVQREFQRYTSQGAVVEDFSYGPIALNGTIERIRVRARESGDTANPGDLSIVAEMS